MKKHALLATAFLVFTCSLVRAEGDSLFAPPVIHEINITFSQPAFWDSLVLYYTLDKMMAGDVEIDGRMLPNTGIQLKGNSSYLFYPGVKKPFDIDFNEFVDGQDFDGLTKINLNNGFKDPTMMREKLFLEFCRNIGLPAPRCAYARVSLNGEYWGLYTVVEQVNKKFLGNWFEDNDGNLFKGDPMGTLVWKGPDAAAYYSDYALKTNETANDWSDLVNLIDTINNTPLAGFHTAIDSAMDISSWMNYQAAGILFANLDSYSGSGHNYYLYHDLTDGKFKWIVWDVNEAFGNFTMGMNLEAIQNLSVLYIPSPAASRPLTNRMLQDAGFRSEYLERICQLSTEWFRTDLLFPLIDSLANAIRTDYYADPNKMFTNQEFEDNIVQAIPMPGGGQIAGLKSFLTARRESLVQQMEPYGCQLAVPDPESGSGLTVSPNPVTGTMWIRPDQAVAGLYREAEYRLYNSVGKPVMTLRGGEKGEASADLSGLPEGMYLLVSGIGSPVRVLRITAR